MQSLSETKIDDVGVAEGVVNVQVFVDVIGGLKEVPVSLPTTLWQIYERYKSATFIYVVVDGMLSGTIYRCGNYGDGEWQQYAKTQGMA